jgi:hypothetical protein
MRAAAIHAIALVGTTLAIPLADMANEETRLAAPRDRTG